MVSPIDKAVRLITNRLSDSELTAIYLAAVAGFDPTPVIGYEKARSLFTGVRGGVPVVHDATLEVLAAVVQERLRK